ncbi:30S ribosomal protein S24e [Oxyplasma meridianum]|uniref:Small ribosomal subunit protein eS24 n=1 Tax=Oxyplasma meridianum TaxID=3073602 RepID=A0AAX4NFB3_9ARCH
MAEIKIESSVENKLLKRTEIRYTVSFKNSPTPKRESIRDMLAKNTGSKIDLVIVDRNLQGTGVHSLKGYAKIYKDRESAMLYEPDYELYRNNLKTKEEKA